MPLVAEHDEASYVHGGTQKDDYTADDVVPVPCPYCGSSKGDSIYTEHSVIGICACRECGLVYTSPRLKVPEAIYWGNAELYFSEARLIFEGRATHHRDPNYGSEIRRIERFKARGRFLDVGCNMGMLLRLARARGWDVFGVEPSPSLSGLASKWGFKVYNCLLHELPAEEAAAFDVVALSDVLEHIADPRAFLATARHYLKPDGVLYAKVPNALWSMAKHRVLNALGRHPRKGLWDSYEHVVHYTDVTLRRMLQACAFDVREIFIEPPVQTPNWHEHVGHYYQYPTPWPMDWRRKLVRSACYRLSLVERLLRGGRVGYLAPNVAAISQRHGD